MKLHIKIKNIILIASMMAFILVSCKKEANDRRSGDDDITRAIQFSALLDPGKTKSEIRDTEDNLEVVDESDLTRVYGDELGLYVIYTGTDLYNQDNIYSKNQFVYYNDILRKNQGSNLWEADPIRYWPSNGENISFFAIAPRPYDENTQYKVNPGQIYFEDLVFAEGPFLHFDPLYSFENIDKKYEEGKKVNFKLKHAMSKFTFKVKVDFSEEELEKFWNHFMPKKGAKNRSYFYINCEDEPGSGTWWNTRWKVTLFDLFFLVDNVKIQNARSSGTMNLLAQSAENLWVSSGDEPTINFNIENKDIVEKILYEQYSIPIEDGLNHDLVWDNVSDEAKHDSKKENLAPWVDKQSIARPDLTVADSQFRNSHVIFKKDIFIVPGDYSREEDKLEISIDFHALLLGVFQKEFNGVDLLASTVEDEDSPGWYWYKDEGKLQEYPQYRRFYAKANKEDIDKKIGPVKLGLKTIEAGRHYNVTLGIGTTTNVLEVTVSPWEIEENEVEIDDSDHDIPAIQEELIWDGKQELDHEQLSNVTVLDVASQEIALGRFKLAEKKGARILAQLIPIKGSPDAFDFVDSKGSPLGHNFIMKLDGSEKLIRVKNFSEAQSQNQSSPNVLNQENEAILRFYIKFSDGTSSIVKGLNGKQDGEFILRQKGGNNV